MGVTELRKIGLAAGLVIAGLAAPAAGMPDADPLPRRAWLGALLESTDGAVRIREILIDSSAGAAGLEPGDILSTIDGRPLDRVADAVQALSRLKGGATAKVEIVRDGQKRPVDLPLREWPLEAGSDRHRVEYGSVPSASGHLRTITLVPTTEPAEGRRPALLVVQGLGLATLDNPRPDQPADRPTGMGIYRAIAAKLADSGFVTLRVDKAGCGDSQGRAEALDFLDELDGYRAALKALKARPDVDPERVFLFGHSMGGVFGPILAGEGGVRGVAVAGTLTKTWLEYVLENARRQQKLAGSNPAEIDRDQRRTALFHYELLVAKKAPRAILEDHPDMAPIADDLMLDGDQMYGRHHSFFPQLAEVNLPEAWLKVDADVLAIWGEAEFVSGRDDHEQIADIANRRGEGRGTFLALANSDHAFTTYATPEVAFRDRNAATAAPPFNPAILDVLASWMSKRADLHDAGPRE